MSGTDNMSYWNCDNYCLPLQVQISNHKTGKDMSTEGNVRVMTTHRLLEMKQSGEKIAMLTAYDYTSARILDEAGIDIILVGDSAANVMAGHSIVLSLTCIIFVTMQIGPAIGGPMTGISVLITIFMDAVELLVAFIQAYVFTMLSAVFIGLAHQESHSPKKEINN